MPASEDGRKLRWNPGAESPAWTLSHWASRRSRYRKALQVAGSSSCTAYPRSPPGCEPPCGAGSDPRRDIHPGGNSRQCRTARPANARCDAAQGHRPDGWLLDPAQVHERYAGETDAINAFNAARGDEYGEIIRKCEDFLQQLEREHLAEHFTFAELEENEVDLGSCRAGWRSPRSRRLRSSRAAGGRAVTAAVRGGARAVRRSRVHARRGRELRSECPRNRPPGAPRSSSSTQCGSSGRTAVGRRPAAQAPTASVSPQELTPGYPSAGAYNTSSG